MAHQGFQTREDRWKHEAEGRVRLSFSIDFTARLTYKEKRKYSRHFHILFKVLLIIKLRNSFIRVWCFIKLKGFGIAWKSWVTPHSCVSNHMHVAKSTSLWPVGWLPLLGVINEFEKYHHYHHSRMGHEALIFITHLRELRGAKEKYCKTRKKIIVGNKPFKFFVYSNELALLKWSKSPAGKS